MASNSERGFSFAKDGPLDMRMDRTQGRTAADLVNEDDEETLANLIYRLGEERDSRRIARAIVLERQHGRIERTLKLAEIVEKHNGLWSPEAEKYLLENAPAI